MRLLVAKTSQWHGFTTPFVSLTNKDSEIPFVPESCTVDNNNHELELTVRLSQVPFNKDVNRLKSLFKPLTQSGFVVIAVYNPINEN